MNQLSVKQSVEAFWKKNAGSSIQDCFPAWYLNHVLGVPVIEAFKNSSEPQDHVGPNNYDFGIDAFHILRSENKVKLLLIQAKYSNSLTYINAGYKSFEKSVPILKNIFCKQDSNVIYQNKVIVNLRAAVNLLSASDLNELILDFLIIHLSEEKEELIMHNSSKKRAELGDLIENELPNNAYSIRIEGPNKWGFDTVVNPIGWTNLYIVGRKFRESDESNNQMYIGLGKLSELVELYNQRRYHLFSKNVRYFIKSKKNVEIGPSAKMKDTLKSICIPNNNVLDPGIFSFFHNGVTIFSKDIDNGENEHEIKVRDPYVLNGCQTIKTAFLFFSDPKYNSRIDKDAWEKIYVPLRIISTRNEDLVRLITINNNRQNSISYDALRANDPIQLELEVAFKNRGIFYERQQGAFANLEDTNPEAFETYYSNTCGKRINIVELGRTIAAAAGELSQAQSPSHIFESDAAYSRIFSQKRLQSKIFLVFLQNLHDVLPLVVKMDLGLKKIGNGPTPSRLSYYALSLLIKYIESTENIEVIKKYGTKLWGRNKDFRKVIRKLLDNYHSKIEKNLKENFITLEISKQESLMSAYNSSLYQYSCEYDIFTLVKNLDQLFPVKID